MREYNNSNKSESICSRLRAKRREERKHKAFITLAVIILSSIIILYRSIKVDANTSSKYTYKYFVTVDVVAGDTLSDIASRYYNDAYADLDSYMDDICLLNNINRNYIHEGAQILVPIYSNEELPYVGYKIN